MDEYLTPDEVAERLKLHPYTIRKLLRSGELPGKKIGGKEWRVSAGALDVYMHSARAADPASKKRLSKRAKR